MSRLQVILTQLLSQYTQLVSQHRKQTMIVGAGVGGLVLILGVSWVVMSLLLTTPVPDVRTATVQEVADFMADEHGLARLPIPKRKKVFIDMMSYYAKNAGRREMLAARFERMAPSERSVIRDAVFEIVKVDFLTDAKTFNKLPEKKKNEFVKNKLDAYESLRQELRGGTDGGPNIGSSFAGDPGIPRKSDQFAKALVTRTNARQRALARPYADRLGKIIEKRRQQPTQRRGSRPFEG